ncbi:hypothetical protein MUCCIDRAFT_155297 [Mucor lusitanicus CBS 277.49]|uniref:Protein S-acyltransferase n=1 Tax=Mucor lusitanicus CBS 277.49 TaxID=747725 RepID=A0A168NJ13_MUCCL|nr:hypothetical protein MUCCIDRAFT_155297 [Mucor lusitanicus CBS 277.49]
MIVNRKWVPLLTGVEGLGLEGISVHWYSVTVLGFLFGLTLLGFTGVHFYYITRNKTSIEHVASRPTYIRVDFDKSGNNYEIIPIDPKTNLYDRGFYKNWCSVMGSNPFTCLLPYVDFCVAKKDLFEKIHPYNANFRNSVVQTAKLHRENRLKEG